MTDNRVGVEISEADKQALLAAIETIRQKLPLLIDLTPEQRRSPRMKGDSHEAQNS